MDSRERNSIASINMALIFDALDKMMAEANGTSEMMVAVLSRDKLAFTLMNELVLRPSELLCINIASFRKPSNKDIKYLNSKLVDGIPLLVVDVQKGKNPWRKRTLPIFDKGIVSMLEHYLAEVRPNFSKNCDKCEPALFLSSHGTRMSYAVLRQRFLDVGMVEQGYGLNSIRRSALYKKLGKGSLAEDYLWVGHIFKQTTVCCWHYHKE